MKRFKRIVLCLVLLVLIMAAVFFWRHRSYVLALRNGLRYSSEELQQQIAENGQRVQQTVENNPELQVRGLTDEEKQALLDGSLSKEEIVSKLIETQPDSSQETSVADEADSPEDPPQETPVAPPAEQITANDYQRELSALVAETYVLQTEYEQSLDALELAAKQDYRALNRENATAKKKLEMVGRYASQALELEKNCDAKLFGIAEKMEALIKENNGNLEIVDTVIETYLSEKSLKKAYYISELEKRGLL